MDGFAVDTEELGRLARCFEEAACTLTERALGVAAVAADPLLLTAGLASPLGLVRVAVAVAQAEQQLLGLAGALEADARRLKATRAGYEVVESGLAQDAQVVLRRLLPGQRRQHELPSVRAVAEAALTAVAAPRLSRPVGLLTTVLARPLAALSADGPGGAVEHRPRPAQADVGSCAWAEQGLPDSLLRIAMLPGQSDIGRTDVITLTRLGGEPPHYRLELPGMARLGPGGDPMTLPGAVAAELGRSSAYSRAVQAAVELADVPVGAQLLLVGHSEGGIAAMNLAADPSFNGSRVQVTHVVAAGSPIDGKRLPAGSATSVLSLQNVNDAVPALDGMAPRRTASNRLTYTFSRDTGSVIANHSAELYADQARRVLADSPQPEARAFVDGLAPYYLPAGGQTRYFALTERRTG
ncbi:MAG: hypothetical protein NVSMB13_20920 [Mycobacteriales bacterium]